MTIKKAVITAAGFGSRFLPITKTFPKELLPVVDKPIIHYLVEECAQAGIEEVIIVASPSEISTFENYFYGRATDIRTLMIRQNKLERWSKVEKIFELPLITIIPEDRRIPYGNGRPILSVKDLLANEEAFVAMFGDDMFLSEVSGVRQLIDKYNTHPSDALLAVQRMPQEVLHKFGIIKPKDNTIDVVESIVEKPEVGNEPSNLADYGRYIFTPKLFDYLHPDNTGKDGEVYLMEAVRELAREGLVTYAELDGTWFTTGDPFQYLRAHINFALKNSEIGSQLKDFLREKARELDAE